MVGQVELARQQQPDLRRVTISGVGEPLHNASTVEAFVLWCRDQALAPSLTTSGGPLPTLRHFIDLPHNGLTISVHAGSEALRQQLVPHGPALDPLFHLVEEVFPRLSRSRQRRLSLAYLLIGGCNDGVEEARAFADRALRVGASVYLYRLNPVAGSCFAPATDDTYARTYETFRQVGLEVRRSSLARIEDNGGCGTLLARPVIPP